MMCGTTSRTARSPGLGGWGPAASRSKRSTETIASSTLLPISAGLVADSSERRLDRPWAYGSPTPRVMVRKRRSASMRQTREPLRAATRARWKAMVLLPSPGRVLWTAVTVAPVPGVATNLRLPSSSRRLESKPSDDRAPRAIGTRCTRGSSASTGSFRPWRSSALSTGSRRRR